MRVFVALWPPPEALTHLQVAVEAARAAVSDAVEPRWIPAARQHLTLAFVGEVDDEGLANVLRRTQRAAAPVPPLPLALARAGRFGSAVLWTGLMGDVEPLGELARRIGWQDKPFRAHLTVARGRGRADLRPWVAALAAYEGPAWTAEGITVVRSTLGPSPTYEVLEQLRFAS